jgi:hypothetical protein
MSGRRSFQAYPAELPGGAGGGGGGGGGGFTAGLDLSGSSSAQEVVGILSHLLPSLAPGLLQWTGAAWAFTAAAAIFTPAGDLTGSSTSQEVIGILSQALPPLTPGFLQWTGTNWAFSIPSGTFTAGGDLAGTSISQEVVGILSEPLPSLSTGFLNWTGAAWAFSPATNFTAAGDLSGSSSSQEVIGIRSNSVPALASGFLQWTGTVFAWSTPGGGFSAGGDLSGSSVSQEVIGIRSNSVPALASGFLQWNGTVFAWTTPGGGFSAGGDLSGSSSSQEVVGLLTHALPPLTTGFLEWNALLASFSWAIPSGGFTPGSDLNGNGTSTSTNQYVSGLSFSSAAAGGTIPVNGTNTVLNWVTNAITLQQGGAPLLQLKALSTDFLRLGAAPPALGFLRIGVGAGGADLPITIMATETSGGATTLMLLSNAGDLDIGFVIMAAPSSVGTGQALRLFAQNAGGSANAGGSIFLNAGTATTSGNSGSVFVDLFAPPSSGAEGFFAINRSGTQKISLGWSAGGSESVLLLGSAGTITATNFTLAGDGLNTYLATNNNAGTIEFDIGTSATTVAAFLLSEVWFGVPIGGSPGLAPLQFKALTGALSVAASFALTAVQYANPIIQLTGTNSGITITVPNNVGATWWFDFTNVVFSNTGITFSTGSGTSATVVSANLAVGKSVRVQVVASNFVSVG